VRAFLITTGILFALLVVVHIARIQAEPALARDPWYWVITVLAAGLSLWAWRLVWQSRRT